MASWKLWCSFSFFLPMIVLLLTCLGLLLQVADGTKHLPHLWDLCSNEIVVRSAKHILKVMRMILPTSTSFGLEMKKWWDEMHTLFHLMPYSFTVMILQRGVTVTVRHLVPAVGVIGRTYQLACTCLKQKGSLAYLACMHVKKYFLFTSNFPFFSA